MSKINKKGFTLPEFLTVIAILGLIIVAVFALYEGILKTTIKAESDIESTARRMTAGNYLRQQISESSGLIIQPVHSDAHAPGGVWPAIHPSDNDQTKLPIVNGIKPIMYYKSLTYNSSQQVINQINGSPEEDEHVLYLNTTNKKLFVRNIANPVSGNVMKTSCPSENATAACPADHEVLQNVTKVGFQYLSKTGEVMDYYQVINATDPACAPNPVADNEYCQPGPDFEVVEVVELRPFVSIKSKGQSSNQTQSETVMRAAVRNK